MATAYGGQLHLSEMITAAIDDWARAHPEDALPWDEYADESTLSAPRYLRKPRKSRRAS
ncbi:MAG: hypothetical protein ACHQUB_02005 [Candidatus Saccharimonadia bacterium]